MKRAPGPCHIRRAGGRDAQPDGGAAHARRRGKRGWEERKERAVADPQVVSFRVGNREHERPTIVQFRAALGSQGHTTRAGGWRGRRTPAAPLAERLVTTRTGSQYFRISTKQQTKRCWAWGGRRGEVGGGVGEGSPKYGTGTCVLTEPVTS